MENQKVNGFYDIVKLCKGGLTLVLPAFDASSNDRTVNIASDATKIRVARVYALGIFTDPTLERMYNQGYFRIEPVKAFEEDANAIFASQPDRIEVEDDKDIVTMLQKGNRAAIKKLITDNGEVNRQKVLVLARQHIGELSTSMVADLEKILNIELVVEDEENVGNE